MAVQEKNKSGGNPYLTRTHAPEAGVNVSTGRAWLSSAVNWGDRGFGRAALANRRI